MVSAAVVRVSAAVARARAVAEMATEVAARDQAVGAKEKGVVAMAEAVVEGWEATEACLVAAVPTAEKDSLDPSPAEAAQSSTHGRSAPASRTCRRAVP